MPQSNSSRRFVLRLVLFTLAGWLLWALGRESDQPDSETVTVSGGNDAPRARAKSGGFSKRRLATTLAFTTLFFAGAAFSAGAGNELVCQLESGCDAASTSTEAAAGESSASTEPAAEEQPAGEEGS